MNSTYLIYSEVEKYFDDADIIGKIERGETEPIKNLLIDLVENWPTFGDYIYFYLFENVHGLKTEFETYMDVPDDKYYDTIQDLFEENGLGGRGSLNSRSTPLSRRINDFTKQSYRVTREVAFLFSVGLNMSIEDAENLLEKALLQSSFNPKNYKEVIYKYCIEHYNVGKLRLSKIEEWIQFYLNLDINNVNISFFTDKKNLTVRSQSGEMINIKDFTQDTSTKLFSEIQKIVKEDEDLKLYLFHLKRLEGKIGGPMSPNYVYKKLIRDISRSYNLELNDVNSYLPTSKIIAHIHELSQEALIEYDESLLLDKKTLKLLFDRITLSPREVNGRIEGTTKVSRNDLMFFTYYNFANDTFSKDEDFSIPVNINDQQDVMDIYYYDFQQDWETTAYNTGMDNLIYIRNPFELFLVYCSIQRNPLKYFLASWKKSLQE